MSAGDEGTHFYGDGCPTEHGQTFPRVFRDGGPPPPADVLALVDRRDGYWPRLGVDCWICPGGDPHTWHEMSSAGPFVEAPLIPNATEVAAAIAADDARRK